MTDDSESNWGYVCVACTTIEDSNGNTHNADKVRDGLNSRSSAETLAQIHRVKTGHEPTVEHDPTAVSEGGRA